MSGHSTVKGPHWERVVEVSPPDLPQAAESGVTVAWLWGEGPWGNLTYPQSNPRGPNPPDLGRRVLVGIIRERSKLLTIVRS